MVYLELRLRDGAAMFPRGVSLCLRQDRRQQIRSGLQQPSPDDAGCTHAITCAQDSATVWQRPKSRCSLNHPTTETSIVDKLGQD